MTDLVTPVTITRITPHWRPPPRVSPEKEAFIRGEVASLVGALRHQITTSNHPCIPLLDLTTFSYKVYDRKLKIFHGPPENRQFTVIRPGENPEHDHLVECSSELLSWLKDLYSEDTASQPSTPSTPLRRVGGSFPTPPASPPGASPEGDSEASLSPEEMAELDEANQELTAYERRYLASTDPRRDPTPSARSPSPPLPPRSFFQRAVSYLPSLLEQGAATLLSGLLPRPHAAAVHHGQSPPGPLQPEAPPPSPHTAPDDEAVHGQPPPGPLRPPSAPLTLPPQPLIAEPLPLRTPSTTPNSQPHPVPPTLSPSLRLPIDATPRSPQIPHGEEPLVSDEDLAILEKQVRAWHAEIDPDAEAEQALRDDDASSSSSWPPLPKPWPPTHAPLPLIPEMTPLRRDTSIILPTAVDVSQPRRRTIAPNREPLPLSLSPFMPERYSEERPPTVRDTVTSERPHTPPVDPTGAKDRFESRPVALTEISPPAPLPRLNPSPPTDALVEHAERLYARLLALNAEAARRALHRREGSIERPGDSARDSAPRISPFPEDVFAEAKEQLEVILHALDSTRDRFGPPATEDRTSPRDTPPYREPSPSITSSTSWISPSATRTGSPAIPVDHPRRLFDESLDLPLRHPLQLTEETSESYHESNRDILDYEEEDRIQLGIALARDRRDLFRDRGGSARSVTPISEVSDEYLADDEGSITPTRPSPTGSRASLTESSSDLGDADSIAEVLDDALRDIATLRGRALRLELIQRALTQALRGERRGHQELREASARAIAALEETIRRLQEELRHRATSDTLSTPSSSSDTSSSSSDESDPRGIRSSSSSASAANLAAAKTLRRVREAGRVPPPPVGPPIDTEALRADLLAAIDQIRPEIDALRQGWRDLYETSLATLVREEARARELLAATEHTEFPAIQARMQEFQRERAALQAQLANVRRLEAALALKTAETTTGAEEKQALARQVAQLEDEKRALTARESELRDQVAQSGRDLDRIGDLAVGVQESLRRDREAALAELAALHAQYDALARSATALVPDLEAGERDLLVEAEGQGRAVIEALRGQLNERAREQSDFLREIAARDAAFREASLQQREIAARVLELQRGQEEASRKEEEQQALINKLLTETTTRIEELERELHTARELVARLEARLHESSEAAGELAAGAERRTRRLHTQRDTATARVADLERELAGVRATAEEDHARLTRELAALEAAHEAQRTALQRDLRAARQEAADEFAARRADHDEATARIATLQERLREAQAENQRISGIGAHLAEEAGTAHARLTTLRAEARARIAYLERDLVTARQDAAAATLGLGGARARISTLERAATASLVDTEARSRLDIEELYEQFLATAAITKDTLKFSDRELARRALVEGHLTEITARLDRLSTPQQRLMERESLARRDIDRTYSDGLRTKELGALRARLAQSNREKQALAAEVEATRAQDRMLGAELARRRAERERQEALLRATSPTATEEAAGRRAIVSQESAGRDLIAAHRRVIATEKDLRRGIEDSEARDRGLLAAPRAAFAAAITRQVAASTLAIRPVMVDREAAAALAIETVHRAVSPILRMTRDALTEYDPPTPSGIEWPTLDTSGAAPIFPVDDGSDDYPSTQATTPRRIADFESDAESLPDTVYDAPAPPPSPPARSPRTGRAIDAGLAREVAPLQLPRDGSARGAFLLRHALLVGDASMKDVFPNGKRGIKFKFEEPLRALIKDLPETYTYIVGAPDLSDPRPFVQPTYPNPKDPELVGYYLIVEADKIVSLAVQPTAATAAEAVLQRFLPRISAFKTSLRGASATPEGRAALVVEAMTKSDFTQYFQRLITTRHQLLHAIEKAKVKPKSPWASEKSNPVATLRAQQAALEAEIAFYAALRRRDPTPPRAAAAAAGGGGGGEYADE
jgi:hypothetical protein